MSSAAAPILSQDDRAEVLRMFTEQTKKYGELSAAIAAGKPQGEIKTAIDKIDADFVAMQEKYAEMGRRADVIEAALNRRPAETETPKSIGRQVVEDAGFLAAVKSPAGRFSYTVMVKTGLWSQKAPVTGVSRGIPEPIATVTQGPRLPFGVRSLVPQGSTTAGAVSYVEETSFTNAAAPVLENTAKPQSAKVFTPKTQIVETIAHYFKISKQTLNDLPAVEAAIENNGVYGVQIVEDDQLLNGSGTAPNLRGFNTVAVAAPAPPVGPPAPTSIDAIGYAYFDLAAKGYLPDGVVMNPADWGKVAMLKNTQGNYIFANPIEYAAVPRLWGMRLVLSAKEAAGSFLVGAFTGNSQILDREQVNVQVATQNEDDFIKNMVTILVEERLTLLIFNAAAFEKGTALLLAAEESEGPTGGGGRRPAEESESSGVGRKR
jgi:HK97 family phage major capsid protein